MNYEPTVNRYLTKNELYEEFGRHPRTLTKDITKALANGDQELLSLAQLHTKNDRVIAATDATSNTWKELTDNGDNPAWYFLPEFVEVVRKRTSKQHSPRRSVPIPGDAKSSESTPSPEWENSAKFNTERGESPRLPDNPALKAIVLEHLHFHNLKHESENKDLMDRILKLVETNQELQAQSNTLFNQFQLKLQGPGVSAIVTENQRSEPANKRNAASQPTQPTGHPVDVPEGDIVVIEERVVSKSQSKPPTTKTKAKSKSSHPNSTKKKTPAKAIASSRKSATKKKAARKTGKVIAQSRAKPLVEKPKGLLGRIFGNRNDR